MSGSRPRNTSRQVVASATAPASAGPTSPGRTQAVERTANILGRSSSGNARPIAHVADRRDGAGAETLEDAATDEDGHRRGQPADDQADREEAERGDHRPDEAAPVDEPPATMIPTMLARKNAEKTQP